MGLDQHWTLWCSTCYKEYDPEDEFAVYELRYQAGKSGWVITEGLDLCPNCAKEADDD